MWIMRAGVWLFVQLQETPLHWAARKGHEAVTRALVDGGADVNAKTYLVQSQCSVMGCVLMGVVAEAACGVWLHVQWQTTPLHEATKRGHAGVMKLLQKTPGTRENSEL